MRLADYRLTLLVTGLALVSTLGLFALAPGGWPGQDNGCRDEMRPQCFCERPRDGHVAQPANTFSNLGFVFAGIGIAFWRDRQRTRGGRPARLNPMTTTDLYPGLYAAITMWLGPGSMALHATLTFWGGSVDLASMYLYIALVLVLGLRRLYRLSTRTLIAIYVPAVAVLVASKLWTPLDPNVVFGTLVTGVAVVEPLTWRRRPELRLDPRALITALALFLTAFAIWVPSLSGGPFCDPDSPVQGHALWHLLCAGATIALFAYQLSEDGSGG